jgi:hypothetical protein
MNENPLVGTWRLVSWNIKSADGEVNYPFGKDALGYITYTEDGYVFVVIMTANRLQFASADLLGGTAEEKIAVAETCIGYCGTYTIRGDRVFHHVEVSSFPNWVGSDQERIIELKENTLLLKTLPYLLSGKQQTAYLLWERV